MYQFFSIRSKSMIHTCPVSSTRKLPRWASECVHPKFSGSCARFCRMGRSFAHSWTGVLSRWNFWIWWTDSPTLFFQFLFSRMSNWQPSSIIYFPAWWRAASITPILCSRGLPIWLAWIGCKGIHWKAVASVCWSDKVRLSFWFSKATILGMWSPFS